MQIRNDFNAYSGTEYQQSHTHHVTECLHEDKKKQQSAAAMGTRKDTGLTAGRETVSDKMTVDRRESGNVKASGRIKTGMGLLKDAWQALGEEGQQEKDKSNRISDGTGILHSGLNAVVSAWKQSFSSHIVNKWEAVKEKIRVGIHSSLKRFQKGKDAFAALTDTGSQTAGGKGMGRQQTLEDKQRGTRAQKEEIPTAYRSDSHLMDSYSKTGEYCRLNENLTYRKNPHVNRSEKPIKDSEEMLDKG